MDEPCAVQLYHKSTTQVKITEAVLRIAVRNFNNLQLYACAIDINRFLSKTKSCEAVSFRIAQPRVTIGTLEAYLWLL